MSLHYSVSLESDNKVGGFSILLVNWDCDVSDHQDRFSTIVNVIFHELGFVKGVVFLGGRQDGCMESEITFPVVQKFWMIISEDREFL